MAFKVFEAVNPQIDSPALTFQPTGQMRLNTVAAKELRAMDASHVLVLWDPDTLRMAIKPTATDDRRSYSLNYHPRGSGANFSAKAFVKFIGWTKTSSISIVLVKDHGMLIAELPKEFVGTLATTTSSKKHRKKKGEP